MGHDREARPAAAGGPTRRVLMESGAGLALGAALPGATTRVVALGTQTG